MGIIEYLENLRKRPERERRNAVLKISFLVTLIIVAIWAIGLSLRIDDTDFSFQNKEDRQETPRLTETFSKFIDQVGNIIGGLEPQESTNETE